MIEAALIAGIAFALGYAVGAVRQAQRNARSISPVYCVGTIKTDGARLPPIISITEGFGSGVTIASDERGGVGDGSGGIGFRPAPPRVGFRTTRGDA